MHSTNCLNCQTSLANDQKFCSVCGQKADTHRITLAHFFHEFFHAFTHADKGILFLLKGLATKPGTVAREYIQGKRKKYFSPFTFFLLVTALFVLSSTSFMEMPKAEPDPVMMAHIPTQEARQNYIDGMQRVNKATWFMTKKTNIVAMIAIPFLSLITWLFFYKRGFNYAEHLTANLLFISFSNLLFAVLIYPFMRSFDKGVGGGQLYLLMGGLFLQALYHAWSLNGFLSLNKARQRVKSFSVAILAIFLWSMLSLTAIAVYIYQSWKFPDFFKGMFSILS